MRELGASDKFFYYSYAYANTFHELIRLEIRDFRPLLFQEAANEALRIFNEYALRPVIRDNKLYAEEISGPVAFYEEPAPEELHFGTDDTNGYLFYFTYTQSTVTLNVYHGLADFVVLLDFVKCILALYAQKAGFKVPEEDKSFPRCRMEEKDLDPYRYYGNAEAVPEYSYSFPGAFAIPGEYDGECGYLHGFSIILSTSAFIEKTKELGVSFIPLMSSVVSRAAGSSFDTAGRPVVAMIPVNMRPYLGADTRVNFSDGVFLPLACDHFHGPIEDVCMSLKEIMKKQITADNFRRMIANKANAVYGFENEEKSICELAREKNLLPPPGTVRPVSYAISYPGKISFSEGLDELLLDVSLSMWVRGNSIICYTFRDKMEILLQCRTDKETWAKAVNKGFLELGLLTQFRDLGRTSGSSIVLEELETRYERTQTGGCPHP